MSNPINDAAVGRRSSFFIHDGSAIRKIRFLRRLLSAYGYDGHSVSRCRGLQKDLPYLNPTFVSGESLVEKANFILPLKNVSTSAELRSSCPVKIIKRR